MSGGLSDTMLREMLKTHEGLRLKPYQCTAGCWTVGYGHNLEAHGEAVPQSITRQQAEDYLDADVASASAGCGKAFPWFKDLDPVRQAVLVDMCFNLGIAGLKGFVKTMESVRKGLYAVAGVQMLQSKWASQVKGRAVRLANMMAKGRWPEDIA